MITDEAVEAAARAIMADELLPCPFCGSKEMALSYVGQPAQHYMIACVTCGAHGPTSREVTGTGVAADGAPNAAVTDWNTREQGPGPGEAVAWRPVTAEMDYVGSALCAVRVYTGGKFLGWDIHYVVIDDETREIAPDFEQGWALSDYEFWMPVEPPAVIAGTPTREA